MTKARGAAVAVLLAAAFAACAHDPARDQPIVPWGSANDAPTGTAGDDGGWFAGDAGADDAATPAQDAAP